MVTHPVVSHEAWIEARRQLLAKEKEFTRLRDELSAERRALPWEAVSKDYVFLGPNGRETLADLFDGRSQLVVQHFMLGPGWEEGCKNCSFWADNFNGIDIHLAHRDVTFVAVSSASFDEIDAYRRRMGWSFKWVSSFGSDFNYDYQVAFKPEDMTSGQVYYNYRKTKAMSPELVGVSVFFKDETGAIYHTYSAYSRGVDILNGAYNYIDLTPKGRDEGERNQFWVRRHDEYQA